MEGTTRTRKYKTAIIAWLTTFLVRPEVQCLEPLALHVLCDQLNPFDRSSRDQQPFLNHLPMSGFTFSVSSSVCDAHNVCGWLTGWSPYCCFSPVRLGVHKYGRNGPLGPAATKSPKLCKFLKIHLLQLQSTRKPIGARL
ncbi:hypothetical protein C7974DRAFT_61056 [Boeremia exigua]|uniref:uncharacterized protein n=1 Tax=Boeremia exigua TaxID=749465 RepID=UPI001E8E7BD5|nr:uncharacterized protein C7974DRAFT_61056 [Boeremia exigua]KAH6615211.1 hypothetical protein C7974DRAFT_61056 [Boeremia exigua]